MALELKGSASNNDVMITEKKQKKWAYFCMVQVNGVT